MIRQNTPSVSAARRRLTQTDQLAANYPAAARSSLKCKAARWWSVKNPQCSAARHVFALQGEGRNADGTN